MKNNLRYLFTALLIMFGMTAMAQEVTLDFTTNDWGLPTDYVTDAASYTNTNGYTVTINASNGHKFNEKDQYLIWGKQDATFTLPAFDFAVERIDVTGREGASGNTLQNIYVGEEAVSTETKGVTGTNTYMIAEAYQAAGKVFVLKINSNHNSQITKIEIFKKGEAGPIKTAKPTISPNGGEFEESIEVTLNHEDPEATIFYTLNTEDWNMAKEAKAGDKITLYQTTVLRAKAFDYENEWSDVVTATFTKKEATEVVVATCAEVLAGTDGTVYQVRGKCTEIKNTTYGNWNLEDETGAVYIYGTLDAEGKTKNFSSLGIEVGDIVTVQGPRKDFNGTIELVDVTVVKIEKGGEPQTTIEKVSVAKALEIIAGLEDGKKTDKEYDVEGYIVTVDEWSPKTADGGYGNATFDINDTEGNTANVLKVFRAKNAEGENFTDEDTPFVVGEKVIVRGLLQKYVNKDGVMTPEVAQYGKVIFRTSNTAVSTIKAEAQQSVIYNLQGQQVMQPTKGLYIINGKKVVVK